jgi:hypothetical protein
MVAAVVVVLVYTLGFKEAFVSVSSTTGTRTCPRGLLVASCGQFSDKGYVRVASRVNPPPDKGMYELRRSTAS